MIISKLFYLEDRIRKLLRKGLNRLPGYTASDPLRPRVFLQLAVFIQGPSKSFQQYKSIDNVGLRL